MVTDFSLFEYKIIDNNLDELKKISDISKLANHKIIWTNGCFDILHEGHIRYLQKAKELGDILIVGLNSDSSVKALKGPTRPVQNQTSRSIILSSLIFTDFIFITNDTDMCNILRTVKPDVFVKGGDYTLQKMSQDERKIIEDYGGEIVFLELVAGNSTTKILERIAAS